MAYSVSNNNSHTDVVYQEVFLFIEGVQVPYQSISVNSQADGLPTAFISLSPTLGMEDIARYYQPKVHIFYMDHIQGKVCLLFAGKIDNVSYSKSTGSSYKEISYQCTHRYSLVRDIQLLYASYTQEGTYLNSNPADATLQVNKFSSAQSLLQAMRGVTSTGNGVTAANPNGDPSSLAKGMDAFQRRLSGIPGVFWNLWSQLKAQSYYYKTKGQSQAMTDLYIPLMEDGESSGGLQFFKRLAGHLVIEDVVESTREDGKLPNNVDVGKIVIPPALKAFAQGGLSAELMFRVLEQAGQFSNEVTNLFDMFENFLRSSDYEMVILNSPAEPNDSTGQAIDVIFKPQTPFYYSPICNVILPQMYETLQIQEADSSMPTRLTGTSSIPLSKGGEYLTFRGPASIREAIAAGQDLESTISYSHDKVGKFEFGRGIKPINILLPTWLSMFAAYKQKNPDSSGSIFLPQEVAALKAGWDARYGTANSKLNPWADGNGVPDYQRVMFATMDYKYSQAIASSRLGSIQAYFNPYIIAGYPMDVIDKDVDAPCYHGLCTAVTHNFTPQTMATSISFVGAMSYDELYNYYVPPNHPWLDGVLNLSASQSLVGNASAKATADTFYDQVLGVKAAAPDDLYDFKNNAPIPITLNSSGVFEKGSPTSRTGPNGGELNPYLTYQGNLSLVYREIETLDSFSSRFGLSFIQFSDMNTNSTIRRFTHPSAGTSLRELGESKFLDY